MSRVKKTLLNAKVNLFFYFASTLVAFFTRKIFLTYLGDEFIGLTGTLNSILGFLNLAELGVGTAVGYALYKPIYNKDKEEINRIVSLLGYIYKRIGALIVILAIITSTFFFLIFKDTDFSLALVYYCFFSFLFSSLLGYFINYHQSLLQADQKGYLTAGYLQSTNLVRQLLQAYIAYKTQDPFLWVTLEILFTIIYSVIIRTVIKRTYPWLNIKGKKLKNGVKEYPLIINKIKQVFVHKISSFVTFGTDQILIFSLVNIESVAFVGNYNLIITAMDKSIQNLFGGIVASIGNLTAEGNKKLINSVFWEIMTLRFFIAGFVIINLFFFLNPLIELWLGEKYILGSWVFILLLANLAIKIIRATVDNYISAMGLFDDTWAPIAQMSINLVFSILFGFYYGIAGILFGTTISSFTIIILWKPHFLFKKGFGLNTTRYYWVKFGKLSLCFSFTFLIVYLIHEYFLTFFEVSNYTNLLMKALLISVLVLIVYIPILFFSIKETKLLFDRVLSKIKK